MAKKTEITFSLANLTASTNAGGGGTGGGKGAGSALPARLRAPLNQMAYLAIAGGEQGRDISDVPTVVEGATNRIALTSAQGAPKFAARFETVPKALASAKVVSVEALAAPPVVFHKQSTNGDWFTCCAITGHALNVTSAALVEVGGAVSLTSAKGLAMMRDLAEHFGIKLDASLTV